MAKICTSIYQVALDKNHLLQVIDSYEVTVIKQKLGFGRFYFWSFSMRI